MLLIEMKFYYNVSTVVVTSYTTILNERCLVATFSLKIKNVWWKLSTERKKERANCSNGKARRGVRLEQPNSYKWSDFALHFWWCWCLFCHTNKCRFVGSISQIHRFVQWVNLAWILRFLSNNSNFHGFVTLHFAFRWHFFFPLSYVATSIGKMQTDICLYI